MRGRAVDNLLMNVLVHTPGGTVGSISASAAGDQVSIESPTTVPGSHRTSCRTSSSASSAPVPGRARPGSGLGLAVAAEIASAHGGTARAAPVSPHGLRITLTVPAGRPPDPRSAAELAASAG